MAEVVCTPFWQSHVQTEETDFCTTVSAALFSTGAVAPSESSGGLGFEGNLDYLNVNTVSGGSVVEPAPSNFYEPSIFYFFTSNVNPPLPIFNGDLLIGETAGDFEFTVSISGRYPPVELVFYVYDHDPSVYESVDKAQERVILEYTVENLNSGDTRTFWMGLFYAVQFDTSGPDSFRLFDNASDAQIFKGNVSYGVIDEGEVFITLITTGISDGGGLFYLSNTLVYQHNDASRLGTYLDPSADEIYAPRLMCFSGVNDIPDKTNENDGYFVNSSPQNIKVTPTRWLSVPYGHAQSPVFNSNDPLYGQLVSSEPNVLSTNPSDATLGLVRIITAVGF